MFSSIERQGKGLREKLKVKMGIIFQKKTLDIFYIII